MNSRRGVTIGHITFILLHFTVLGCLVLFTYMAWDDYDVISGWSKVVSNLALIMLIFQLLSFRFKRVEYTDFRLWFIALSYLFMFGRVFLHGYDLDGRIFSNFMVRYSSENLFHVSMFILCCIQSLFIGFVMLDNKKKIMAKTIEIWKVPKNDSMYVAGVILFVFSIPFRLFTDITGIIATQASSRYSALTSRSGLADDFAFLAIPSIIYIMTSGKLRRRTVVTIVFATVAYFVIVMVLTGDRRYPITAILALILCYFKVYGIKLKISRIVVWGFGAMLILNVLAVIRTIRSNELTSLGRFFTTYGTRILFGTSTVYETLAEFGATFFSVVLVFKYVPSYVPFQHGLSFIRSVPSLLPIGWLVGEFFAKASVSDVINSVEGLQVGGSLVGDLYANFGWLAIVAGIVTGISMYKVFQVSSGENDRLEYAKYFSLFYILINLVRACFFEIFRLSIMAYFVPIFIMWIAKKPAMRNEELTQKSTPNR